MVKSQPVLSPSISNTGIFKTSSQRQVGWKHDLAMSCSPILDLADEGSGIDPITSYLLVSAICS
jgi:hypothetical protein